MTPAQRLRDRLLAPGLVEAPGCHDALSARLVERAGFEAAYVTGFGASASRLGAPDVGLLSFKEMADHVAAIADAVSIPLVADADDGYGGVANVQRTVRSFARAGTAAIQIEDQAAPKRCGHTRGKRVLARGDAVLRIRAAADACRAEGVLLVARTDARAVLGLDEALARCRAFAEVGADVIFLEAPASAAELARLRDEVSLPLLWNALEGGLSPPIPREDLPGLGVRVVIHPLTLLYVAAEAIRRHLARPGGFAPWDGPLDFAGLQDLVGFPAHDRLVARYAGDARAHGEGDPDPAAPVAP